MIKKVLILGAYGMLGSSVSLTCKPKYTTLAIDRSECDITQIDSIYSVVHNYKPDCIINCAAYTAVDLCEGEAKLLNFQVNTLGVYNLALVSKIKNIKLIHISTDYVFDGLQKSGYLPEDTANPLNMYGMAKYLGEQYIRQTLDDTDISYSIIRTSWLYGSGPSYKNFVNTIIQASSTKNELQVVNDQYGAPTYVQTLVDCVMDCIASDQYRGTIHCTDVVPSPGITWYDFAQAIVGHTSHDCKVLPCNSDLYPRPARRPAYSYLINSYQASQDRKKNLSSYIHQHYASLAV